MSTISTPSPITCEVKTLNISDEETFARHNQRVRKIPNQLEQGFFNKLMSQMEKAKEQMEVYEDGAGVRRIAYVVICFDDLLAEYKEHYYRQIDQYLTDNLLPGIEVVFHNQKTCFHKAIDMTSATVFNE